MADDFKCGGGTPRSIAWAGPEALVKKIRCHPPKQRAKFSKFVYDGMKPDALRVRVGRERLRVRVGSANVGSMTGRSEEVAVMLDQRRVDVCAVQEVRWKGDGTKVLKSGKVKFKLMWQGNETRVGGVGIAVAEKWWDSVVEVMRWSDRLMGVRIVIEGEIWTFVSGYAPQSGSEESEKDSFWELMDNMMADLREDKHVVVAGDMNGHVGRDAEGFEDVHGGEGYGSRNRDGVRVLEFCEAKDMVIGNTWFRKRVEHLVTYRSGECDSQIDLVMMRSGDKKMLKDCKSIPGQEVLTQHRLVVGVLEGGWCKIAKRQTVRRVRVWRLKDREVCEKYRVRVKSLEDSKDLGVRMVRAATEVCGKTNGKGCRRKETWYWCKEVEEAVVAKKQAYRVWQEDKKNYEKKEKYREMNKASKRAVAIARDVEYRKWGDELETKEGRQSIFRIAKQMVKEKQEVVGGTVVRDKSGKLLVQDSQICDRWIDYFEELMNEENVWSGECASEAVEGPMQEISKEEVREALKKAKSWKAAGPSQLSMEMMKEMGDDAVEWLTEKFNEAVGSGKMPEEWKDSLIIPLYKGKGDALACGSHRGIKLLEHEMKVYERVLEKRLRECVKIDDMQFGFMPGKSTTDAVFVLRMLQEKWLGKGKKLYHVFVDLEKAYDRVPRRVVEWALRRQGVCESLVRAVMLLFDGARMKVRCRQGLSRLAFVLVGLHQGSVLSPLLFAIVMEEVSKLIRSGLPWEELFADDLVVTDQEEKMMWVRFDEWKTVLEVKGLRVNMSKTKVMVSGEKNEAEKSGKWPCCVCRKGVGVNAIKCQTCLEWCHAKCSGFKGKLKEGLNFVCRRCRREMGEGKIKLMRSDVEKVSKFCYLGDVLESGGGCDAAVKARVRAAWKKWREHGALLVRKQIPLDVRMRVYEACVRSVMLYGCENWAVKVEHVRMVEAAEMRMLRWMCGVRWEDRVSNEEVRWRAGVFRIEEEMRCRRLRWFGHVMRKSDEDKVKQCMLMEVEGARPRGRPRKRWMEVIEDDMRRRGVEIEDSLDRMCWRRAIRYRPTPHREKRP